MALQQLFFQKITKNRDYVLRPQNPSVTRLSYTSLFTMSPNLDIFTFQHLLQVIPLQQNPGCLPNQPPVSDLPFYDIFVP